MCHLMCHCDAIVIYGWLDRIGGGALDDEADEELDEEVEEGKEEGASDGDGKGEGQEYPPVPRQYVKAFQYYQHDVGQAWHDK